MPEGIQVLCIDDEPVLLETAKHFLELRGDILVDTASSARAALDRISGKKYHIIVTDFQMPGMDGIEFLKRVRVTDKNIPIIILTGRGREEVVIKALNNGANFYLQKGGSPDSLYTELGHVIRQLAVMQRTQMTLAEQEQRFHDVQNANDLIQSVSPEGRFLFVNKKWLDTLGYRESDLGRLTIFDIIHEDSLNHCREIFSRVIAGENVGIIEAAFRTSDGGKVYVEGMTSCRMVDGHCQYTRGIFKDITQKKEIEKGLFESENKFATVFKSNPVPLTLVAVSDGVFVDVNDAFLQCTGYERSDVIGKTSRELQFFPDEREYNRWVAALRQKKDLRNHEISCRVRNGEIRTCRFSSSIIMTASEPHILSTIEDITEQKAAESALHALVSGLVGTTGIESLDRIALSIHEWLGADCIMIGKILPDRENVRVLSMLLDGKKIEDYSYSLKGTPCENTAQKRICIYPDNVASLFPSSKDLREFNIQGYIGIPLNDSVGSVIGILCILTRKPLNLPSSVPRIIDIIAAKAAVEVDRFSAQEALADSEKKFRTLVEYSLDGIIIEDLEGTILFVNPAAGCILESENYRDLAGRTNVMEFISPESRAALLHDLNEASNGADGFVSRYKIITLKKNERWIEGIGKFIVFNGRPAILISARDVTDRQMAEDALSKNRQQLEDAMALTRMVEWEYHPATGLLHLNDHLFTLLRTTAEREGSYTMTPEAFAREFVHPDDRIWVVSGLAKAVESADPQYTAWRSARIVRRDGEVRDILVFVRFIPQTAREQAMLHGTIQDVTEQKNVEIALRQANKKLNLLSGITRHDINNQLLTLNGFIEILRDKNPLAAGDPAFSRIKEASRVISEMIRFTKDYEQVGVKAPVWHDLPSLVTEAGQITTHGPVLIRNEFPEGSEVFADPLITKVFFNLIDNAIRHGGAITTIRFFLSTKNGDRTIVCEDDGEGVDIHVKEKIFERSFGKNTGFGLFISREILGITGMTIRETGTPGNGARFEIDVPPGHLRLPKNFPNGQ